MKAIAKVIQTSIQYYNKITKGIETPVGSNSRICANYVNKTAILKWKTKYLMVNIQSETRNL